MLLKDTAQLTALKNKHRIKNNLTALELTPMQDVRRRNKILRKGMVDGKYVTGGSVMIETSHQRISAWKRIKA